MTENDIVEILEDRENYKWVSMPTGQIINGSKVTEQIVQLDFDKAAHAILDKLKEENSNITVTAEYSKDNIKTY